MIYIILLLVAASCVAGCLKTPAKKQEAGTIPAANREAQYLQMVASMEEESSEIPPAPEPAEPTPQYGPDLLFLGEGYRFGPPVATCEARITAYRFMDRYHSWDPLTGKFFPHVPASGASHFIFVSLEIVNHGEEAMWVPTAAAFRLCANATCYGNLPYQNTSGYDESALELLTDTYQWIREVPVDQRDYAYLRENWYLSSGHAGGFLWPGESNSIEGYLVYEVPRHLDPAYTTMDVSFNSRSRAAWVLVARPDTMEQEGLYPAMEAEPGEGVPPLQVRFRDLTVGEADSRLWDFGDGSQSAETDPVHIYRDPGIYTVTLEVRNPRASNHTMERGLITVWDPPPVFAAHPVTLRAGREGRIAAGSYLRFHLTGEPGLLIVNGTVQQMEADTIATLVFPSDQSGVIRISGGLVQAFSAGDASLYVSSLFRDRGPVQGYNIPSCTVLPSALRVHLPGDRVYTSMTWDDRDVLFSEEYGQITVDHVGMDTTRSLELMMLPNRSILRGNASGYAIDTIIGAETGPVVAHD